MRANKPLRIVSLVPSQTELLYTLGLDDEVVGITKFCIHPASWFKTKTRQFWSIPFKTQTERLIDLEKIKEDIRKDLKK